jgi:hypothetical protein
MADRLARSGAAAKNAGGTAPATLYAAHELRDEFRLIDQHALDRWQAEYDSSSKGAAYRSLEPLVSVKAKFSAASRSKETLITRLRLGRCSLNHYLHQIKAHPDGLCAACKLHPETISHFLLECSTNTVAAKLRDRCQAVQLEPSLSSILASRDLQDLVYDLVLASQRKL